MKPLKMMLLTAGALALTGCQAQPDGPAATDVQIRPKYGVQTPSSSLNSAVTASNQPVSISSPTPQPQTTASAASAAPANSGPMNISQMTVGRLVLPQSMQSSVPQAPAAPPPISTGQTVVVQLRRDALGLASPAPLDPLFEGVRFPVSLEGNLESIDERWVVLNADGRRLCINRDAVLLIYPRNEAGRREGATAKPSGAPLSGGSSGGSSGGVDPAKVDPAGRPAMRGGSEGQGAN